ncbi:uncharacterized protein LOC107610402 [Arachis ipaensis]|uniref:Transposase MuDR plant domain-containing protein n=1 Tax=Arachis hypogaea TaxID=3818 RepID=A0A445B0I5_ARAHY|nr:uncharacterized protein LOC107610402 [Arachis ipaensis]RYR32146.1 hypothetical protein Ahy_B01g057139 [Arachis hypogaea]
MPVGASSAVPVIVPEAILVASPSFAANLNRNRDEGIGDTGPLGEVAIVTLGTPFMVPVFGEGGIPDSVEDALQDDDDDDVAPATIADYSDNDIARTTPVVGGGASSSGTHHVAGYHQQFQDKEEIVLSVKSYSIRRGVEYKVLESDHRKYYCKGKEFGNGCIWLIRVSLRQRRGIWEVKWYNDPHPCLATLISNDHKMLDYHVVSTFILPMIKADVAVSIKVLQNATEAYFGFRPTYRRVWMDKQKAVAQSYGGWEES